MLHAGGDKCPESGMTFAVAGADNLQVAAPLMPHCRADCCHWNLLCNISMPCRYLYAKRDTPAQLILDRLVSAWGCADDSCAVFQFADLEEHVMPGGEGKVMWVEDGARHLEAGATHALPCLIVLRNIDAEGRAQDAADSTPDSADVHRCS